jgi:hypothetical protein
MEPKTKMELEEVVGRRLVEMPNAKKKRKTSRLLVYGGERSLLAADAGNWAPRGYSPRCSSAHSAPPIRSMRLPPPPHLWSSFSRFGPLGNQIDLLFACDCLNVLSSPQSWSICCCACVNFPSILARAKNMRILEFQEKRKFENIFQYFDYFITHVPLFGLVTRPSSSA